MQLQLTNSDLMLWSSHFTNNEELPFITCSALIGLEDLETFVAAIKEQKADSVRVYFFRFSPTDTPVNDVLVDGKPAHGCKWLTTTQGLTQATIALVPTQNLKHDKDFIFSADDIFIKNQITALIPGIIQQGTCMNPPGTSGIAKPAGH